MSSAEVVEEDPRTVDGYRLQRPGHVKYFSRHLRVLPEPYTSLDGNRMTALYFVISGLDVLGVLRDQRQLEDIRGHIVPWVEAMLVTTEGEIGYRSGPYLGLPFGAGPNDPGKKPNNPDADDNNDNQHKEKDHELPPGNDSPHDKHDHKDNNNNNNNNSCCQHGHPAATAESLAMDQCHIAMTYTALCIFRILGVGTGNADRAGILRTLASLQQRDGSFAGYSHAGECDMRFVFCAAAICHLLDHNLKRNIFKLFA